MSAEQRCPHGPPVRMQGQSEIPDRLGRVPESMKNDDAASATVQRYRLSTLDNLARAQGRDGGRLVAGPDSAPRNPGDSADHRGGDGATECDDRQTVSLVPRHAGVHLDAPAINAALEVRDPSEARRPQPMGGGQAAHSTVAIHDGFTLGIERVDVIIEL